MWFLCHITKALFPSLPMHSVSWYLSWPWAYFYIPYSCVFAVSPKWLTSAWILSDIHRQRAAYPKVQVPFSSESCRLKYWLTLTMHIGQDQTQWCRILCPGYPSTPSLHLFFSTRQDWANRVRRPPWGPMLRAGGSVGSWRSRLSLHQLGRNGHSDAELASRG